MGEPKPNEIRFTVTDAGWFVGVLVFTYGGIAIGLALLESVVTP